MFVSFKHLLVPLDGSRLAEVALPVAAYMAEIFGAVVTLIHIIERDAPQEIHSDHHLREAAEAEAYLTEVAQRAFPPGIPVERHVHTSPMSDVARSIAEHSVELAPDLVVMCSHGRGGPRDWLFGSIAQQVIGFGKTPVLLIPPHEDLQAVSHCARILVPLDGTFEHEQGLPFAVGLAKVCGAGLHLMMVIPTMRTLNWDKAATGRMLPGSMSAVLDLAEQGGKDYLAQHIQRLQSDGLEVSAEIARGDPVAAIVKTTERVHADMIVFGTHAKTGMDAFWEGSVTPKVAGRVRVPLLLVPVSDVTPKNPVI